MLAHTPGLRVVMPSSPARAYGLLLAAIRDPDPVIFFEPKRIYNGPFTGFYDKPVEPWKKHPDSVVPEGYYKVPLGKARHVREGEALTVYKKSLDDGTCRIGIVKLDGKTASQACVTFCK